MSDPDLHWVMQKPAAHLKAGVSCLAPNLMPNFTVSTRKEVGCFHFRKERPPMAKDGSGL